MALCAGLVAAFSPGSHTAGPLGLREGLLADDKLTAYVDTADFPKAVAMYEELTGRTSLPSPLTPLEQFDEYLGGRLVRWHLIQSSGRPRINTGINYHRDGRWTALEVKEQLDVFFESRRLKAVSAGQRGFRLVPVTAASDGLPGGATRRGRRT